MAIDSLLARYPSTFKNETWVIHEGNDSIFITDRNPTCTKSGFRMEKDCPELTIIIELASRGCLSTEPTEQNDDNSNGGKIDVNLSK